MAGSPNLLAGVIERLKHSVVSRVIGVLVLVVVSGAAVGAKYVIAAFQHKSEGSTFVQAAPRPHAAPAVTRTGGTPVATVASSPSPTVAVPATAKTAPAAKAAPPANAATALANPSRTKPGAVKPVSAVPAESATRLASSADDGAAVVKATPEPGTPVAGDAAHLDEHLTYQYNALGRRDPFQSLVDGAFVGADVGGDAPPDPGGMKVVGIVWGATDQFALVEDVRGNSFVLRRGDKLQNGYVEGLKRDGVVVNVTADGQSQSVVIPLVRKGDQNAR